MMGRLINARNNHISRWVIPAARKLLIDAACNNAPTKSLMEVAHLEMGQSPDGDSCNDNEDGIPLIGGPADLGLVYPQATRWTNAPTKICQSGDIIVCVRATIGEPRWADGIYCLGRGVAGIRPTDPNIDSQFLFRVIEGNEQTLKNQGTGTTFKAISKHDLGSIMVPLIPREQQEAIGKFLSWLEQYSTNNTRPDFSKAPPLPNIISDQLRIIARIEELVGRIAEARGLRKGAVEEAEQLLIRATVSALSSTKWEKIPIGNLLRENSQNGLSSFPSSDPPGTPILRISAATSRDDAIINENDYRYVELSDQDISKYKVKYDDILVCRFNGNLHYVGRFALYTNYSGITQVYPDKLIRLRVDTNKVLAKFVCLAANSSEGRKAIETFCATTAGNIGISATNLKSVPIPVPPLSEQKRIVDYLDTFQSYKLTIKQKQAEASAELDALLPSILDKAFKGEL
jgi:restriction endonuclease S subunit